eukprot:c18496_g1_i1 orf=29-808(-)
MELTNKRLLNKVAIITGAASGIGAKTAELFVANGAKVVIADIQDEKGAELACSLGDNADYVHCDVTQEEDISAAVDFAVSKYGKLDIMFNNAGVISDNLDPFATLDIQVFDHVYSVNTRGAVLGVKHAARVMIPAKKGCILFTASVLSIVGGRYQNAYTISKHAIVGIVRAAASELGQYGIRVNCISPQAVPTPMIMKAMALIPREELGGGTQMSPPVLKGVNMGTEDIAAAALFLASEEARCISGQNVLVDGGWATSK